MLKKGKILVVDDNQGIREALKILLGGCFERVETLPSPVSLMRTVESLRPDVILLDMNFKTDINTGNEGLFWLSEIKARWPEQAVVLFTAYADIALAVEGMKRGAEDFIVKPWENAKLIETLTGIRDKKKAAPKVKAADEGPRMFWGESVVMQRLRSNVEKIATTDATVLITGENGTGKDVLAHEIHSLSGRSAGPMVCVDAGAITETLFESELFGHVKGAFTDAHTDHTGKMEQANGSTLFLDEIGNIPLHLQAKLLRVLQNRSVTKVGDTRSIPIDIRLICATNKNLEEMVKQGTFREDLYYRINTIHLELPPLRERPDEIVPLANLFISRYAEKYHRPVTGLTDAARQVLLANRWSGNIRELQNGIEKAVILADGDKLDAEDFSLPLSVPGEAEPAAAAETLEEVEERTIRAAMDRFGGNLTHVAKSLNISRPTLYAKLKKYNI